MRSFNFAILKIYVVLSVKMPLSLFSFIQYSVVHVTCYHLLKFVTPCLLHRFYQDHALNGEETVVAIVSTPTFQQHNSLITFNFIFVIMICRIVVVKGSLYREIAYKLR